MKRIYTVIISFSLLMSLLITSCGQEKPSDEPPPPVEDFRLEFTATDIFGNSVNQDTIGEKEFYFIYLWATWCPPCVRSMPDLAEIARDYSERVGFIGLLDDFDNKSGAVSIVESAGIPAEFVMINAKEPSVSDLLENVRTGFVPAAIVLTNDGRYLSIQAPYRAGLDGILS
jgi:thiol-disulfide isomerase/thioredoxin